MCRRNVGDKTRIEATTMKLFYLAGSCALAPHIALEHSGLTYEAVRVERGKQTDPSYLAINPLGRVPALVSAAHGTITEVPAVLSFIADLATDRGLLPAVGTPDRYEALRWMAYLSSTVHPSFGRLWRAERFAADADCVGSVEQAAAAQLAGEFAHIDKLLAARQWVVGNDPTVADYYLFVFGRWGLRLPADTRKFPSFHRHTLSVASLAATKRAISQQGITFEGPATGPG
jgi:glutathione S-transferase